MKILYLVMLLFLISSCKNEGHYEKAEDAQEAGREFIRASLDGNYDKARFYLFRDTADLNVRLLDRWKQAYDNLPQKDKQGYRDASIMPVEIKALKDSTTYSYAFYNSYKRDTTTIKVIKVKDEWLVDLSDIH